MKTFKKLFYSIGMLAALLPGLTLNAQMDGSMMQGKEDRSGMSMDMDKGAMHERCEEMKEHMQQMQERMQGMEEELQNQLQAMSEAEGDAKIDAMAETIRTLANQRQQMLQQRQDMMSKMMSHMGKHMSMKGNDGERGQMMMNCPMMKMMMGSDSGSDAKGHHRAKGSS